MFVSTRSAAAVHGGASAGLIARAIGWILAVCGAVGLLAATTLTVEKIRLLARASRCATTARS